MIREPSIDDYFAELTEGGGAAAVDEKRVVSLVRAYLEAVREFLAARHHAEHSGREVNELHSDLMDRLVRRLFWFGEESFYSEGGDAQSELAVLAVGGYARREMSIYSDVDLLFLHRGNVTPFVKTVTERLQYWMWDAALQVGCATRTIAETIDLAKKDSTVFTAVLNPRLLAGSGVLFHEFGVRRRSHLLRDPAKFIKEQRAATNQRHADFGDTLYLLQPNVKDGEGTLRDYHAAYWVMQATQQGGRRVEEFLNIGLLTQDEVAELVCALDFIWRVRNELHLTAGRKNDQMSFDFQERMATSLGYAEDAGSDLPVERFMRDFYRHARAIRNYSSLVIEQCQARVRGVPRKRKVKVVERGFRIAAGQLEIPYGRQLRNSPLDLLNAFAVAQQHDVPLTRKARRLIRENLHVIDEAYRSNPAAVAAFERILDGENRVMRTLMVMNEEGVLGALIPEWEQIVCRWQHIMYHTYTVDVHTIFLVEELRRLWKGEYEAFVPDLTELIRQNPDRPVVFLGCLLHDIGKGLGGNHSGKGAVFARNVVDRLGISEERADRVVFLVEHHLLMSHLAQSRDLTDPKMIVDFARTVGNRRNLRDLYLVTFADIRASSASAWTEWKGQLLRELFERTSEFIETGGDDARRAVEIIEARVEIRRDAAATELVKMGVPETDVLEYFEMMPRRYFISHAPRQIARHAVVVLGQKEGKSFTTAVREMRGGFSELILCTRDVHGLYSRVAGVLTAHGINILASNVYTMRSALALEIYRVTTPDGGENERQLAWRDFERSLEAVLEDGTRLDALIESRGRRVPRTLKPVRSNSVEVGISNEESDFYTIVDVKTNDRIGLLYSLTRGIADLGLEIYISKAATVLDQVQDTFYLKNDEGKKVLDPAKLEELHARMVAAAKGADDAG